MGGGATNTGGLAGLGLGAALEIMTGGAVTPFLGAGALGLGGIGAGFGALSKTKIASDPAGAFTDIGGGENAASNAKTAATDQASKAASLQQQLLEQPKNVSPDNFLATKNRMLNNMRLGLASTITSGAGTPSPVLSAPALSGNGKKTLGS